MSIDVSGARDALRDAFQNTTATKVGGAAVRCGCASKNLSLVEGDAVVVRSGFILTFHPDVNPGYIPDDRVRVASLPGRVLRIVGPRASNLGLTAAYEAVEVR